LRDKTGLINRLAHKTPFYYGWLILFAAGDAMFVRNAAASLIPSSAGLPTNTVSA